MTGKEEYKKVYKIRNSMDKVLKLEWIKFSLIGTFIIVTVLQMISFGLLGVDFFGISLGAENSWKVWTSLTAAMIGGSLATFAGLRMAAGRKDFFIYRLSASVAFLINNISLGLYSGVIKVLVIQGIIIAQKIHWNKGEGTHIESGAMSWTIFAVILIFGAGAGVGIGFGMSYSNTNGWLNLLDGISLVFSITSVILIALKKKQGFILQIISFGSMIVIFSTMQQWSSLVGLSWGVVVAVFGIFNWSYNYNLKNDPSRLFINK